MSWIRHSGSTMVAVASLVGLLTASLLAPWLPLADPDAQDLAQKLQGPSATHWLGTDQLGRDLLARVLAGGRTTVWLAVFVTLLVVGIGCLVGFSAGLSHGWWATGIKRFCDFMLALPSEVVTLGIIGILGTNIGVMIVGLCIAKIPWYVKMLQQSLAFYHQQNYVKVAEVAGKSRWWLVRHHLLPALVSEITVYATLDLSAMVLSIAGLSFLGVGIQPPTAEWGRMLSEAKAVMVIAPWQMVPAGLAIFIVVAALNVIGDKIAEQTTREATR